MSKFQWYFSNHRLWRFRKLIPESWHWLDAKRIIVCGVRQSQRREVCPGSIQERRLDQTHSSSLDGGFWPRSCCLHIPRLMRDSLNYRVAFSASLSLPKRLWGIEKLMRFWERFYRQHMNISHGILREEHRHSISLVQRKSPCIIKYTCILICGYSYGVVVFH